MSDAPQGRDGAALIGSGALLLASVVGVGIAQADGGTNPLLNPTQVHWKAFRTPDNSVACFWNKSAGYLVCQGEHTRPVYLKHLGSKRDSEAFGSSREWGFGNDIACGWDISSSVFQTITCNSRCAQYSA